MTDRSPADPPRPVGHFAPEELSALIDGEAGVIQAEAIEAHLASCDSCSRRHEQLVEARLTLCGLTTPAPRGAAAAAVAAAVSALGRDDAENAGPDGGGSTLDGAAGGPGSAAGRSLVGAGGSGAARRLGAATGAATLTSLDRRRRIRVASVAATVLLVAGGVTGVVLAGRQGGSSSSASSLVPNGILHRSAAAATGSRIIPLGPLRLGTSHGTPKKVWSGPAIADLVPSDVSGFRLRRTTDGSFTATITLRSGHSLSVATIAGLKESRASALLGGRAAGMVHVLSPRLVEITGLTKAESSELKELLS